MAPFSKYISFLFLATLLLPLQINARDSQFFSKVTHFDNNNNNNNVKETELPNKEGPVNKPEQQPAFIPETENSYGLYGHESAQLASTPHTPTTTTKADPYATPTTYESYKNEFEDTSKYPNNKYYNYNYNKDAYNTNQNEISHTRLTGTGYNKNYYNKDSYGGNQNELSDTKYTGGRFNSMENQNNNNAANDRYYYHTKNAANDRYFSYNNNAANNRYSGEKQGMSDTRFLDGGKYFYDVNYEKYNPTLYADTKRGAIPNSWYNNRGSEFGNNKANSYENKNYVEGYQNQEEFEDDQDEFEP